MNILPPLLLAYYLALVVLTIPLAFDVGGIECGLAYSLAMLALYFVLTTLRLATRRLPLARVATVFYYSQHVLMPSLLMHFLQRYPRSGALPPALAVWRYLLVHLTLVFTVAEGFCLLLLIQAASQTLGWLTAHRSDSWLFVSLIGSGCTITGALYFLYRIYIFPLSLDLGNASLLGLFLTVTAGLGLYGIVSGKGSMIESSLLFAYIVRCIYETFPLLSEDATQAVAHVFAQTTANLRLELAHLPRPVADTLLAFLPSLAANLPHSFKAVWDVFFSAVHKLTLPLLVNLAYRIGVFYAATKIIPSLYHTLPHSPARTPQTSSSSLASLGRDDKQSENDKQNDSENDNQNDSENDKQNEQNNKQNENDSRRTRGHRPDRQMVRRPAVIRLLYAYSPCIVIAVYTHLMLLYRGELGSELMLWGWWADADDMVIVVHPWQFWNWINMGTTLLLYMAELSGSNDGAITNHWDVD